MIFQQGDTSKSIRVEVLDDTTGDGVTGLVAGTFPAVSYVRGARSAAVAFGALNDLAAIGSAFTAKGVKEISAANDPGGYRLDLVDAALDPGETDIAIVVSGAGVKRQSYAITLTPFAPYTIDKTDYALSVAGAEAVRDSIFARLFPLLGAGTHSLAKVLTVIAAPFFNKSNGPNRGSAGTVNIRNGADSANLVSQAVNASGYHTAAPTTNLAGS